MWRHLPGPTAVRALLVLSLVALVIVLLFVAVFPWVESIVPGQDVVVDLSASPGRTVGTP